MVLVSDDDEVFGSLEIGAHRSPQRFVRLERSSPVGLVGPQQGLDCEDEDLESVGVRKGCTNLAALDGVQRDDHGTRL